jgi:hypothetical protein
VESLSRAVHLDPNGSSAAAALAGIRAQEDPGAERPLIDRVLARQHDPSLVAAALIARVAVHLNDDHVDAALAATPLG